MAPARLLPAPSGRQQTRQDESLWRCWHGPVRPATYRRGCARRLDERIEWHYTPKHGSWLNMAEPELSMLSDQCLDRRIPDKQTLTEEVAALEDPRNKKRVKAGWHFTTADARVKLNRLYPAM